MKQERAIKVQDLQDALGEFDEDQYIPVSLVSQIVNDLRISTVYIAHCQQDDLITDFDEQAYWIANGKILVTRKRDIALFAEWLKANESKISKAMEIDDDFAEQMESAKSPNDVVRAIRSISK